MRSFILLALLLATACSSGTSEASTADRSAPAKRTRVVRRRPAPPAAMTTAVLIGSWGGEHVALDFDGSNAVLSFDCAAADFTLPVTMTAAGDFEASGTFTGLHGGPVHIDERPNRRDAHFVGHTDGRAMKLRIVDLKGDLIGEFELIKGAAPRIYRCY
jgi:hypothetical protein